MFLSNKILLRDVKYFLIGILFLTLGIRIMGISKLGIAFSDAIPIRLSELLKIPVTLSNIMLGFFTIFVVKVINKSSRLKFESIIISFTLGFFIDFWFKLIPNFNIPNQILKIILFLIGTIILSFGISLYLQPKNYPPDPNDLILICVSDKFKISIFKSKILIDGMYALIAILISAPIGFGSVFYTFCIGYFVDVFLKISKKMYIKGRQ